MEKKITLEEFEKEYLNASLEKMRDAKYPLLFVPFCGSPVPVIIKILNHAQTLACGNFSLIETLEDKIRLKTKKIKPSDILAYAERNHNIVKAALLKPTYEQVIEMIGIDPEINKKKNIIESLRKKLHQAKPGPKRSALEEELDGLRIITEFILPDDFVSWIVCYTLGIDKSDIKSITKKMLLDAAILAKNNHNSPAENLKGLFTDFMIDDINRRSWAEYNMYIQEHKKTKG